MWKWVVSRPGPPSIVIMMVEDSHTDLDLNLSSPGTESQDLDLSPECLTNCTDQEEEAQYYYQ